MPTPFTFHGDEPLPDFLISDLVVGNTLADRGQVLGEVGVVFQHPIKILVVQVLQSRGGVLVLLSDESLHLIFIKRYLVGLQLGRGCQVGLALRS